MKLPAHLSLIALIVALLVFGALLPFLPGRADGLAVALSGMVRVLVGAGLLLTPIGIAWFLAPKSRAGAGSGFPYATAVLIAGSSVWAFVSMAAASFSGYSLGVLTTAVGGCVIWCLAARARVLRAAPIETMRALPLYLILISPVTAAILWWAVPRAADFSRARAIRNSAALIGDIERYRAERGTYPPSLLSLNNDYPTSVIGVAEYAYEPHREAYNVCFENPSSDLATSELVVYNPIGEQTATSHNAHILQFPAERLERARGYFAMHETGYTGWKRFLFD